MCGLIQMEKSFEFKGYKILWIPREEIICMDVIKVKKFKARKEMFELRMEEI